MTYPLLTEDRIKKTILESSDAIAKSASLSKDVLSAVKVIIESIRSGHKLVIFGNGGSAADAQHMAAEFVGRFQLERMSLPAIALTTDTSVLTSLSNDYSFDIVFSRQCEALVEKGDVVIGISTSGSSRNVKRALETATGKGAKTIALLGKKGGEIKGVIDLSIVVDANSTARIQEVHRTLIHVICELAEESLAKDQSL